MEYWERTGPVIRPFAHGAGPVYARLRGQNGNSGQESIVCASNKELCHPAHRQRRVAEFNWEILRRASALNGPTDIALTFVDYLHPKNQRARRFEQLDSTAINFIEEVQRVAAAPVSLISTRFGFRSIIDRRAW